MSILFGCWVEVMGSWVSHVIGINWYYWHDKYSRARLSRFGRPGIVVKHSSPYRIIKHTLPHHIHAPYHIIFSHLNTFMEVPYHIIWLYLTISSNHTLLCPAFTISSFHIFLVAYLSHFTKPSYPTTPYQTWCRFARSR